MFKFIAYYLPALQNMVLGVDIFDEERMNKILGPKKDNRSRGDAAEIHDEIVAPPALEVKEAPIVHAPMGIKRQGIRIFGAAWFVLSRFIKANNV